MPDTDKDHLRFILDYLGERVPPGSRLTLLGGGALSLLGNTRPTIDLDFIGDDSAPTELAKIVVQVAQDWNIFAKPVPLERLIPLPPGSEERAIRIDTFGNLETFVADPYSIAISKLVRGLDTDLADIVFLIQKEYIDLAELEGMVEAVTLRVEEFDIDANEMSGHLEALHNRLE